MKTLAEYPEHQNDSYQQFSDHLLVENGRCEYPYYDQKGSKTNEGLFRHHRRENTVANLCDVKSPKYYDDTYQAADQLVYGNLLEHLFEHILIGEESAVSEGLGFGGAKILISIIDDYFENGRMIYDPACYKDLDEDLFKVLKVRYIQSYQKVKVVFDHNITVCQLALEHLENDDKALVVLGTGLGKTTIGIQIKQDSYKKVLVICPRESIRADWDAMEDFTAVTFAYFSLHCDEMNLDQYDLFIVDEAHHAGWDEETEKGAKEWSKGIRKLLNAGRKVLGLTATPERTDKVDIKKLFKGCVCEGLSIEEAIEQGIIFPFSYTTALYNTDGIKDEMEKLDDGSEECRKLIGQLNVALNNTKNVKEIMLDYKKPSDRVKGIAFAEDIDDVQEVYNILHDVYPNKVIKWIHSKMSDAEVKANKEWFEQTNDGILISIDMVSEGFHPKGINLITMFRKTQSYQVFAQQLGRIIVLDNGKNTDPKAVVFDFVNNIFNVELASDKKDKKKHTIKNIIDALTRTPAYKSEQIIIDNEIVDVVEALRKIKEYTDSAWTAWEDEIMRTYYPTEGIDGCMARINARWEAMGKDL